MSNKLSIRELSRVTGVHRNTITKWIGNETDRDKALAIIQSIPNSNANPPPSSTDPKTGLTWFQSCQREHAIRLRRENDLAERKLIPMALVEAVWRRVIIEFRTRVLNAEVSQQAKDELLQIIEEPKLDEYWEEALKQIEAEEPG